MYRLFVKAILDKIFSFIVLIVLFPAIILISLGLSIINKGTPVFYQERAGKAGKIFKIMKFKTMNDRCDEYGKLLPDSDRLTSIGRFIRSTSLDELPQLINVLKGDMSLVGPRPLLVNYLILYDSFQKRRHEVKPGMTGWAQVNGRNTISWIKKFEMDIWYVDHLSFCLDVKILWYTFIKAVKRENINSTETTTMKPFTGNN